MALDGGAAVWTCVDGVDKPSLESIDLDRSRKIAFGRIARKPAPMLVSNTLTVKMTVKIDNATTGRGLDTRCRQSRGTWAPCPNCIDSFRTPREFSMGRRDTHMGSPLVVWCHGLAA